MDAAGFDSGGFHTGHEKPRNRRVPGFSMREGQTFGDQAPGAGSRFRSGEALLA